uniref:Transcriptional regulator n=1 Tax=Parastrongyloides trichosuri TaxID=131310 RepID=A0A0N4ZJ07_PARTI
MRAQGLGRTAFLEQDLALQLPEVGVFGLFGQQDVDRVQRLLRLAVAIPGDGAGVASGQGDVAGRIVAQGGVGRVHEGADLGHDERVLSHALVAVALVVMGGRLDRWSQGLDPLRGQGVAAEIGIAALIREDFLGAEILEELDHAAPGFPGAFQGAGAGDVGLALLALHVTQGAERAEVLAGGQKRRARVRRAGDRGQGAQRHGHDHRLHPGVLGAVAQGVAVLDVPGLVGDHAQKLVGVLGPQNQAGVQPHDSPARGEGVQVVVVDQQDLDLVRVQAHGVEHGLGPLMDDALDLGVPDQALGLGRGG